jgi:OmpA-OmpF porin, OOP family
MMRCLLIAVMVLAFAAPAMAQRQVAIERLEPAFDRHGFIGIQGTRTPGPLQLDAALWTTWSNRLLELSGLPTGVVVDHRLSSNLMLQLGLGGRFALGLDMPVVLYQSGDRHGLDAEGALPAVAAGDPRVVLRARLVGEEATTEAPDRVEGFGLAALAAVSAPLGSDRGYVAEASSVADLQLVADFHVLGLGMGAMVGWRHRFQNEPVFDVLFRDELRFGLAFEVPLPWGDGWSSLLEVRGWTDARSPFGDSARTGVVGDLGARWRARDWTVTATLGTGLTSGVGTPRIRAMVGVMWSPRVHDTDGDGIPDHRDQCPHEPEDFDGFEDEDVCWDPDNDGDGIPDVDDACPDEPEDFDGFEDEDGCPDGGGPAVPRSPEPPAPQGAVPPAPQDGPPQGAIPGPDDPKAPGGGSETVDRAPSAGPAEDSGPAEDEGHPGALDLPERDDARTPPEGGEGLSPPSPAAK